MTASAFRTVPILQGESRVSGDPAVVFSTVLGSCIATCLYDPVARVGGINHFLLADPGDERPDPAAMQRYGVHAMEVLINAMLAKNCVRDRLRARLFGGAAMFGSRRDIGGDNSRFARRFLADEGIALVAEDVGGTHARRVEFRAGLGLARARRVEDRHAAATKRPVTPPPPPATGGDVEFF